MNQRDHRGIQQGDRCTDDDCWCNDYLLARAKEHRSSNVSTEVQLGWLNELQSIFNEHGIRTLDALRARLADEPKASKPIEVWSVGFDGMVELSEPVTVDDVLYRHPPSQEPDHDPGAVRCAMKHADDIVGDSMDALALRRLAEEVRRLRAAVPADCCSQGSAWADQILAQMGIERRLAHRCISHRQRSCTT